MVFDLNNEGLPIRRAYRWSWKLKSHEMLRHILMMWWWSQTSVRVFLTISKKLLAISVTTRCCLILKLWVQCVIWQSAWLYGISSGNQLWSKECGSHWTIPTTPDPKRNLEASRHDGSIQMVYIQVGRMQYGFSQATVQSEWLPVGQTCNDNFHSTQAVSEVLANTGSTKVQWCAATLCHSHRHSHQYSHHHRTAKSQHISNIIVGILH
jgi:hypothetical protein